MAPAPAPRRTPLDVVALLRTRPLRLIARWPDVLEGVEADFRFRVARLRAVVSPINLRVASRAMPCIKSPDAFAEEWSAKFKRFDSGDARFGVPLAIMSPRGGVSRLKHPRNNTHPPSGARVIWA